MDKIYLGNRNKNSPAKLYVEPLFEKYFKPFFPDSLFLILHTNSIDISKINFSQYRYIFLVQVSDPADYVGKNWKFLFENLQPFLDKTFAVCNYYSQIPFKQISIDLPFIYALNSLSPPELNRQHIKKYICLNNQKHSFRVELVNTLKKHKIFDEGFVTLTDSYFLPSEASMNKVSVDNFAKFTNSSAFNPFPIEFFQTPFHLVTETSINMHQMYITEKTVKPLLAKQLILHVGSPRTIEYLNKQYDLDIPVFQERWNDSNEICEFLKTPLEDLNKIYSAYERSMEVTKFKLQTACEQISYKLFLTSLKKHNIIHT